MLFKDHKNTRKKFNRAEVESILDYTNYKYVNSGGGRGGGGLLRMIYCIHIMTRQEIYGKKKPLPEGVPNSKAQGNFRGQRPTFHCV